MTIQRTSKTSRARWALLLCIAVMIRILCPVSAAAETGSEPVRVPLRGYGRQHDRQPRSSDCQVIISGRYTQRDAAVPDYAIERTARRP